MSVLQENLKHFCKLYSLSYNELSRMSGVPQPSISRTISGTSTPRRALIEKLANALRLNPDDLQMVDLTDDNNRPKPNDSEESLSNKIFWKGAYHAKEFDLNDHKKLSKLISNARSEKQNDFVDDTILTTIQTDEMAPFVPRGNILFIKPEKDQFKPDITSDDEAIGVIGETEDGKGDLAIGKLSVVQGKMFITPLNPSMFDMKAEVCRVTARIKGWAILHR